MTRLKRTDPAGNERDTTRVAGLLMQVDAIDPPYGKEVVAKSCLKRRMTDTSVQSATSVVIGVDVGSGFTKGMPRSSKKNPEVILEHLINVWTQRWGNLKLVTADKEFITAKTLRMCEARGIRIKQAPPDEHDKGNSCVEAEARYIQEIGQMNSNHLKKRVEEGIITEAQ
jgi:hypothetical protein